MRQSTSLCALLVAAAAVAAARSARADEAADTAAARALGGDGITLADNGDCLHAIEKLKRAEELHHAPTTAARLGECEINLGHLVGGTERIQRLLREPQPPNAPAVFVEALTRARRVVERALPRIGTLRISVHAPPGTKVHVTVDGEKLPEALLDNDRPADPGRHTIAATATGFFTSTQEVTLTEAEAGNVSLELQQDKSYRPPPPPAPADGNRGPAAAPVAPASSGVSPASIVAFTLGGIGLAAGAIGGAIVASDSSDLSKSCGASHACPADKAGELSSAKTWATISTVGFGVAGAGVGTGLLLLLLGKHDSREASEAKLRPVVGPLYLGLRGAL